MMRIRRGMGPSPLYGRARASGESRCRAVAVGIVRASFLLPADRRSVPGARIARVHRGMEPAELSSDGRTRRPPDGLVVARGVDRAGAANMPAKTTAHRNAMRRQRITAR